MIRTHAENEARLKSQADDAEFYIVNDCQRPRCAASSLECPHLFVARGATRACGYRAQGATILVCYVAGRAVVTDDGIPITENVQQALAGRRRSC